MTADRVLQLEALRRRAISLRRERRFAEAVSLTVADWNGGHMRWPIGTGAPLPSPDSPLDPMPLGLAAEMGLRDDLPKSPQCSTRQAPRTVGRTLQVDDGLEEYVPGPERPVQRPTHHGEGCLCRRRGEAREAEQAWRQIIRALVEAFFADDPHPIRGVLHPASPWIAACLLSDGTGPSVTTWIRLETSAPTTHHPYSEALEDILNVLIGELLADATTRELGDKTLQRFREAGRLKYDWEFTPHIPGTEEWAARLARRGLKPKDIAAAVGLSPRQLRRREKPAL